MPEIIFLFTSKTESCWLPILTRGLKELLKEEDVEEFQECEDFLISFSQVCNRQFEIKLCIIDHQRPLQEQTAVSLQGKEDTTTIRLCLRKYQGSNK